MPTNNKNEDLLHSWKEISSYLDCDTRTCLRWEKQLGLPVHRISDSSKSRVFAYKEELDKWLKERGSNNLTTKRTIFRGIFEKKRAVILSLLIIVIIAVYFVFIEITRSRQPVDFAIQNSTLIILNEKGKELWRYETGIENLKDEQSYRSHYQFKRLDDTGKSYSSPWLIIKDINLDKKKEVLFSIQTQDEMNEGELICFNYTGKEIWRFSSGKQLKFGQIEYSGDYRIVGFFACDLNLDGKLEIIMSSIQRYNFPCQLVVLDSEGNLLGEYWNSGYLNKFDFVDLNEDGKKEIIAAGQNNEYKKACMVVFDQFSLQGSSPQSGNFKSEELKNGSEKYYILFPRTEIDLVLSPEMEAINTISILHNKKIEVNTVSSRLYYTLDFYLAFDSIRFSHFFERQHMFALNKGTINSTLDQEYKNNLARGILYYNGTEWTNKHAMSNPWNPPEN